MADLYGVRVLAVEGRCLTCRVEELYGERFRLFNSRTLALGFLIDTADWSWWLGRVPVDHDFSMDGLRARAAGTALGCELGDRDYYDPEWIRARVGRFVSCVGVIDRSGPAPDPGDGDEELHRATYLISVTDPKWIEHLAPGMEWESRSWDQDGAVTCKPAWRTSDVLALARGIEADLAFDRMPILADALQDAGCDSDELLSHLRDLNASHVRGCWALDLVLGKE